MYGNGEVSHDHIIRPRAVKPGNPAVLRAMGEESFFAAATGKENNQNGNISGQTRYDELPLSISQLITGLE